MMASFSAYALSVFFLVLFLTSIVMIFTGDVSKNEKLALRHLVTTIGFGFAAYFTAWLGGI